MATVGSLGGITFNVSSRRVLTFDNYSRQGNIKSAEHGIIAVDPHVIPYGTRVYIPGYGFAVAGDTGGAIVGNRIDLFMDSYHDAISFGRRNVEMYILE